MEECVHYSGTVHDQYTVNLNVGSKEVLPK